MNELARGLMEGFVWGFITASIIFIGWFKTKKVKQSK